MARGSSQKHLIFIGLVALATLAINSRLRVAEIILDALPLATKEFCSRDRSWRSVAVPVTTNIELIAHGGGGAPNGKYSNSLEGLSFYYARGHRRFELDFKLTRDGVLVATRDWGKRFIHWHPYEIQTPEQHIKMRFELTLSGALSFTRFVSARNRCGYTAIDLDVLRNWLHNHADAEIVTDIRHTDQSSLFPLLKEKLGTVSSQIIVQISSNQEATAAKLSGFDKVAWRNYKSKMTPADIYKNENLESILAIVFEKSDVAMDRNQSYLEKIKSKGPEIWVFTVNDPEELRALPRDLVDAAMTDYMTPHSY
mgnify:CR=1 FL=1